MWSKSLHVYKNRREIMSLETEDTFFSVAWH